MESYLIKDTTKAEREQIVADSLGNIDGSCDGCAAGLAEMYQDYIDGKRELREINMAFRAHYVSGDEGPEKGSCGYA
ncbi:MAG: purine biosynthesis protein PurH [Lachnospiraceae bacterium]|nr:purine biosynthesis protein PurH [Lachnospiraceae bacterium]